MGKGLSGNLVNAIFMDRSGKILLGTNEGINIQKENGWAVFANIDYGLTDDFVNDIYEDANGTLWVCTNNGVCHRTGAGKWLPFVWNTELPSDTVLCMAVDSENNKWFGTANGLCKFSAGNQSADFLTYDAAEQITEDEIFALSTDASFNLWCATEHGLSVLKNNVWFTYNYSDGLPETFVTSLLIGNDSKIYIGTKGGGISILRSPDESKLPVVDKR